MYYFYSMQDVLQKQNELTPREQEIFNLLLEGISPKEIAYKLNISYHTVDFHRNNIYRKLDVKSIQEFLARYGNTQNGAGIQHSTFFKRSRYMLLLPVGILLLTAAFFSGWYIAKKTSAAELSKKGSFHSLISKESISNSLASEEYPFIIRPFNNYPFGWHYYVTLPMFLEEKITAGDIYTVSITFMSNVDLEALTIALQDMITEEKQTEVLFPHYKVLSDIKANTEYSLHISLIAEKTASSTEPRANNFTLDVWPHTASQPILTFTRFDIERK